MESSSWSPCKESLHWLLHHCMPRVGASAGNCWSQCLDSIMVTWDPQPKKFWHLGLQSTCDYFVCSKFLLWVSKTATFMLCPKLFNPLLPSTNCGFPNLFLVTLPLIAWWQFGQSFMSMLWTCLWDHTAYSYLSDVHYVLQTSVLLWILASIQKYNPAIPTLILPTVLFNIFVWNNPPFSLHLLPYPSAGSQKQDQIGWLKFLLGQIVISWPADTLWFYWLLSYWHHLGFWHGDPPPPIITFPLDFLEQSGPWLHVSLSCTGSWTPIDDQHPCPIFIGLHWLFCIQQHDLDNHNIDSLLHSPLLQHQFWLAQLTLACQTGHQHNWLPSKVCKQLYGIFYNQSPKYPRVELLPFSLVSSNRRNTSHLHQLVAPNTILSLHWFDTLEKG